MNTYYLNQEYRKITSHISVRIHGVPEKTIAFCNGQELVDYEFEKPYLVESIKAKGDTVILDLVEKTSTPTNWAGEEQTSFF